MKIYILLNYLNVITHGLVKLIIVFKPSVLSGDNDTIAVEIDQ